MQVRSNKPSCERPSFSQTATKTDCGLFIMLEGVKHTMDKSDYFDNQTWFLYWRGGFNSLTQRLIFFTFQSWR